jgi:arylsulfatase A-like enzyme
MIRAIALGAAAWLLAGCSAEDASRGGPPTAARMLEPVAGSVLMADAARAEIGGETRPVLDAPEAELLIWRREVTLGSDLRFQVGVPHSLLGAGHVVIDASISSPDPDSRGRTTRDLRVAASATRHRIEAAPTLFDASSAEEREIVISIPDEFQGLEAWLNAVARRLPAEPIALRRFGPVDVRTGDRLAFGYGISEEAWRPGFAAVDFRVRAQADGGPTSTLMEHRLDPATVLADRRWHDARLPLEAWEGRSVTFTFEHEVVAGDTPSPIPGSLPLIANPMLVPGGPRSDATRNLILISLDTLRASSVGAYGYARDTTPQLDRRVASAGARVEWAIAPEPFTPPSHMTMLTGLEPCVHGVRDRSGVLSPDRALLAELMRARGYRTGAFTEDAYVVANAGFARGFDRYVEQRDEESASPGLAPQTFGAARAWLDEADPRPFFLFIHTYEVHDPYTPPAAYDEYFAGDGLVDGVPRRHRKQRDLYDREIRRTDDVLGSFLDALDERGLTESSLVVITSDHGEEFGEHFWAGHGASLTERAIHVPMLFRAPGWIAPGTRVAPPVAMSDLVPTLLDLLEIDTSESFMGRSFASLLRPADAGAVPYAERPILGRASGIESVRTSAYKYIRPLGFDPDAASPEKQASQFLFDLRADPGERTNLVSKRADLRAQAVTALEAGRAACEDFVRVHPARPADPRARERDPGWMIHRDDIDRKLRSLGYLE